MLPEKFPRGEPTPGILPPRNKARKIKMNLRPNMIGWIIRPHNLEEFLTVIFLTNKMIILVKIVNGLKLTLNLIWWGTYMRISRSYSFGHLDQCYE